MQEADTVTEAEAKEGARKREELGILPLAVEWYASCRQSVALTVLVLVIDEFYEFELKQPHTHPTSRLLTPSGLCSLQ